MPTINGVLNEVNPFKSPLVINGAKSRVVNGLRHSGYDKWRIRWNGHQFAPPSKDSVLYLPGVPGFGSTIFDFSGNFLDSAINIDEEVDLSETGIDVTSDASTAIPVGSVIRIDTELMYVSATGVKLTVIRGFEDSPAASHSTATDIYKRTKNDGTITGATWERTGQGLWYLSFDGGDDYIDTGVNPLSTTAGTVMLWFYHISFLTNETLIYDTGGGFFILRSNFSGGEKLKFDFYDGAGKVVSETVSHSLLTWHHVAITWDNTNIEMWKDGVSQGKTLAGTLGSVANNLDIGGTGGVQAHNGYIALPSIETRKLGDSEIPSRFNQERHLFGI